MPLDHGRPTGLEVALRGGKKRLFRAGVTITLRYLDGMDRKISRRPDLLEICDHLNQRLSLKGFKVMRLHIVYRVLLQDHGGGSDIIGSHKGDRAGRNRRIALPYHLLRQ